MEATMATANLNQKATLESMVRLGDSGLTTLEAAGREQTTPASQFTGRTGYDGEFLSGWQIPLPRAIDAAATDMRPLRRGGDGVELKHRHFSVIMSGSRRLPMITASNVDGQASRRLPRIDTWSYDGRL